MLCGKCGHDNPDGYSFCTACGFALQATETGQQTATDTSQIAFAAAPVKSPEPIEVASDANTERKHGAPELKGVGGWLLWFCIMVTIIGPVMLISEAISHPDPVVVSIDLALIVLSVYTGAALWWIKANALGWVMIYFIVLVLLAGLGLVGTFVSSATPAPTASSPSPGAATSFRMLFGAAIWAEYFRRSKRVRSTYGRNL